jgi:hypothetical protein
MPHQTGHPITYNHYFTETLQKIRAERQEGELAKTLKRFFGVDNVREPYCTEHSINLDQLLKIAVAPDRTRYGAFCIN